MYKSYAATTETMPTVLRVVDVQTGIAQRIPVPNQRQFWVTDWWADGRYLGIIAGEDLVEYWVVQGLQAGGE